MSNKLGWIASTLIAGSTVGAVWLMPLIPEANAADCVDYWHQCIDGRDDNGSKPHGCFDEGGVFVSELPCSPLLPPGEVLSTDGDDDITCDFDKTCVSTVKHRGPSTGTGKPRGWPKRAT